MPTINGIIETCLYTDDLPQAMDFYQRVLGFKVMIHDGRFCAMSVAGSHVLLLFKRGGTHDPVNLPGGVIPPHDGYGQEHIGFSVSADQLDAWRKRLSESNIELES